MPMIIVRITGYHVTNDLTNSFARRPSHHLQCKGAENEVESDQENEEDAPPHGQFEGGWDGYGEHLEEDAFEVNGNKHSMNRA